MDRAWLEDWSNATETDKQRIRVIVEKTDWNAVFSGLSHPAEQVLQIISYIGGYDVPREFFLGPSKNHEPPFYDSSIFSKIVNELEKRKLVQRIQHHDGIYLHVRLAVQIAVNKQVKNEIFKCQQRYETTQALLRKSIPHPDITQPGNERSWPASTTYYHCLDGFCRQAILSAPSSRPTQDLELAGLISDGVHFMHERRSQTETMPLLLAASRICESTLPTDPMRVKSLYPSILVLRSKHESCAGIAGRAEAFRLLATATDMHTDYWAELPTDAGSYEAQVRLASLHYDLACNHMQREQLAKADEVFNHVLEVYDKLGSEDAHPVRYALVRCHQALILGSKGQTSEALELANKGYVSVKAMLEQNPHLEVETMFILAMLAFNLGRNKQALELHLAVLKARYKLLGPKHHETLSSQYMVAVCEHNSDVEGRREAEKRLRKILRNTQTDRHWRKEDLARAAFRLCLCLEQDAADIEKTPKKGPLDFESFAEKERLINEADFWAQKASDWREEWYHSLPKDMRKGYLTDKAEMALYDYGVHLGHGRTGGVWNTSEHW